MDWRRLADASGSDDLADDEKEDEDEAEDGKANEALPFAKRGVWKSACGEGSGN